MLLIDSHAHLDFDSYKSDLGQVLERAWKAGVENIITIGLEKGADLNQEAVKLAESEQRIFSTVGVHPHDAALGIQWDGDPQVPVADRLYNKFLEQRDLLLERISNLISHPKVVAVGEVGLDYHYDHAPRSLQRELFRDFVRLAVASKLPLVIHSREADADTAEILRKENAGRTGGVIHCYGGSKVLKELALDLGFYLGIGGPLTYKKAESFRTTVADLPLEMLLVETDCPFLTPEPYRGKRNEPAHVKYVVNELAKIKSLDPELVGQKTAENTKRLFQIP